MRNSVAKRLRKEAKYKPVRTVEVGEPKTLSLSYANFEIQCSKPVDLTPDQLEQKKQYKKLKKNYKG